MQRGIGVTLYSIMDLLHQIFEGGHEPSEISGSKPALSRRSVDFLKRQKLIKKDVVE